jgi:arsenite-transporting ATPase
VDLPFDRAIMDGLIRTTPPGIDELLALLKVVEFMQQHAFERYVLDLAPTGHALRFLESFDLLQAWRTSASRLVVRYGTAANRPLAILVERLRHLGTVRELLRDPARCQFIAVAVPETMVVVELKRMLERLQALGICSRHLIVNMVIPENGCAFCQTKRHEQQRLVQELLTLKLNLIHVPMSAHPPVGLTPLQELAHRLLPPQKETPEEAPPAEESCDLAQVGVQDRTESTHRSWVSRMLHIWK